MMNGGVFPLITVFFIIMTDTIAVIIPTKYIEYVIKSTLGNPNNSHIQPDIAIKIGSLAPHEKKGITLIVAILSSSSAKVLVLIIAGTLHPNPIIIGRNALPDKPNFLNILSRINAIRAIYPVSSNIEKNKNNNNICGTKDNTENTPARTPSTIRPLNHGLAEESPDAASPDNQSVMQTTKFCRITPGEFIPASVQNHPSKIDPSNDGATLLNSPPK